MTPSIVHADGTAGAARAAAVLFRFKENSVRGHNAI